MLRHFGRGKMIQSSNDSCSTFIHSTLRNVHFDQRLIENLYERLATQPNIETQDLHLQAVNGRIMLKGSVSESPMKIRIGSLVAACPHVETVINCLTIRNGLNGVPDYLTVHREH